jgi:hypothetical protein
VISGYIGQNEQWPLFRISDHAVAQVAYQLVSKSTLWLPGATESEAQPIPMCRFEELGEVGPYHLDVDGPSKSGGAARGPFKIQDVRPGHAATFPLLNRKAPAQGCIQKGANTLCWLRASWSSSHFCREFGNRNAAGFIPFSHSRECVRQLIFD